jgi:hypothetical protein
VLSQSLGRLLPAVAERTAVTKAAATRRRYSALIRVGAKRLAAFLKCLLGQFDCARAVASEIAVGLLQVRLGVLERLHRGPNLGMRLTRRRRSGSANWKEHGGRQRQQRDPQNGGFSHQQSSCAYGISHGYSIFIASASAFINPEYRILLRASAN